MEKTLDRAQVLINNGRLGLAEQEIRKHLSENPDDARAHTMLAMCLFDLSCHDDAIESARKALELAPQNPYIYWILGRMYVQLQQLDCAEQYLLQSIALNPECANFYASLSEIYWLQGHYFSLHGIVSIVYKEFLEKGIEAARTGLEIDPNCQQSIFYLAINFIEFGDDYHLEEAVKLANRLLFLSPQSAIAHEIYARILIRKSRARIKKQDLNLILPILEESLRLNPNRDYSKKLAFDLLKSYYRILPDKTHWLFIFLQTIAIITLPLTILTFCFYHAWGWQ